jgi:hypothetical protein
MLQMLALILGKKTDTTSAEKLAIMTKKEKSSERLTESTLSNLWILTPAFCSHTTNKENLNE